MSGSQVRQPYWCTFPVSISEYPPPPRDRYPPCPPNQGNVFPNNTNINGECFLDVPIGTLEEFHVYAVEW